MSAITPNVEQFKALAQAASTDNGTVVMVNLLKYRRSGGSGEYRQYGDAVTAMVERTGGRLIPPTFLPIIAETRSARFNDDVAPTSTVLPSRRTWTRSATRSTSSSR